MSTETPNVPATTTPTSPAYRDGDTVNGHRYDATSNTWVATSAVVPAAPSAPVPVVVNVNQPVYSASDKSVGVAYLLWFFLGMLGIHQFYLGKSGRGLLMLICTLTLVGSVVTAILALIDLFTLPAQVRQVNTQIRVGVR